MEKEILYTKATSNEHIKKLGQYFTDFDIANFMVKWACEKADNMLDPAVGNSVFFKAAKNLYPSCKLTGYEVDKNIIDFFGNPTDATLTIGDYLFEDWNRKYDAIVCNPPYNRFQNVSNRNQIIERIFDYTGVRFSAYTNQYILFLVKSIYQLKDKGRLAYVVPSEFLNSSYGTTIKKMLIEDRLLRAVVNFKSNNKLFFNATTTSCILLIDKEPKSSVKFFNIGSIAELKETEVMTDSSDSFCIEYTKLHARDKWRMFLNQEAQAEYTDLKNLSDFCYVTRGIATGANKYFCLSKSEIKTHSIPKACYTPCICHSSDIKNPIFTTDTFRELENDNKNVYLLDILNNNIDGVERYIEMGIRNGVDKKHLTSNRTPWFSMEQKSASPIWVSSTCRNSMKFVRNLTMAKNLTTFHSICVKERFVSDTDLLFCYFLTPIAQTILKRNRKELGGGLNKFQPNDLNNAEMIDIGLVSAVDRNKILKIYKEMTVCYSEEQIKMLNDVFIKYIE